MARKLASIQVIERVEPIAGADGIEKLTVLGWSVVGKKGEFQVGDRVIYCEIDSILPERSEFEFLRKGCFREAQVDPMGKQVTPAGFRIRTVKLRGQISQGICFPLSILSGAADLQIGTDVTEQIAIAKWEPVVAAGMAGKVKGNFPGFLPKTDETRIQVLHQLLQRHRGKKFVMTEKLDGTSFSAFIWQNEFGICSRNLWLDESDPTSTLCLLAKDLKLEQHLREAKTKHGFDLAIQGEVIGPGVQKNRYGLKQLELHLFSVLNLATGKLVAFDEQRAIANELNLNFVPFLGELQLNHTVDELVEISEGTSELNRNVEREGIVLRPREEEFEADLGGRLSFKVINPKFLLKYDE